MALSPWTRDGDTIRTVQQVVANGPLDSGAGGGRFRDRKPGVKDLPTGPFFAEREDFEGGHVNRPSNMRANDRAGVKPGRILDRSAGECYPGDAGGP